MNEGASPYEALAEIIESELAAVTRRDFPELAALKVRRGAIVRSMPATPPAAARGPLQRCALLQTRVTMQLERMREELLLELRCIRHAQQVAGGYAPARPARVRVSASA